MATVERFLKWHFELFVKAKGQLRGDAWKLSFRNSLWRPIYTINSVDKNKWSLFVSLSVCLSLPSCLPFHSLSVYLVHLYLSAFHFTFSNHLLYTSTPFPSFHSVSHHIAYFGTRSSFSENTLSETMFPFVFVVVLCKDTYGENTAWSVIANYPLGKYGTILMMIFC